MKNLLLFFVLSGWLLNASSQEWFTDNRDGNVYKTITVNGIVWMSENLRFRPSEGYAYFENDPDNEAEYGILYDWKRAMTVCPDGWHLPSGKDFQDLVNSFDQAGSWNIRGTASSAFDIKLAGMQDFEGIYTEMGESGYYWTSTEYDINNAEYFSYLVLTDNHVVDISRKEDMADIHGSEKSSKYSVRCVKNSR